LKNTFLLTDVLPEELPLHYSNYDFYNFIDSSEIWSSISSIESSLGIETEPFSFFISKTGRGKRLMGLPHPISQLIFTKFIELYDEELLHYFKTNHIFSCRYPSAITRQKHMSEDIVEVDIEDWKLERVRNYFKYPKVTIVDLYKSRQLFDLELKYSLLEKLDIQQFFSSIYTHSIEWAYLGTKALAKKIRFNKNTFNLGSVLDRIMQKSNNSETNGILIGPEFSRIVSEVILSRVDKLVYIDLTKRNLLFKDDYEVVRYIDDIFVFTNDNKIAETIIDVYIKRLTEFKLSINHEKKFTEKRPFLKDHSWVPKLKRIISKLSYWLRDESSSFNKKISSKRNIDYKISLINEIKALLNEYTNHSHHIISYLLSTLSTQTEEIFKNLISLEKIQDELINHRLPYVLDIIQYLLILSPNTKNVIKYCKTCYNILNINKDLEELVFKKNYEILKFCDSNNSELLNIVIMSAKLKKDFPKVILSNQLSTTPNYFSLGVISFYLSKFNRKYKYPEICDKVNKVVIDILNDVEFNYHLDINANNVDKQVKFLLCSFAPIILHDLYSANIISIENKVKIKSLFDKINSLLPKIKNEKFVYLFGKYIVELNKPFMRWDYDVDIDIPKIIQRKLEANFLKGYD